MNEEEEEKLKEIMAKYSFYEKEEETEDENGEINKELTTFYECYVDDSQRIPKSILEEIWEEAKKDNRKFHLTNNAAVRQDLCKKMKQILTGEEKEVIDIISNINPKITFHKKTETAALLFQFVGAVSISTMVRIELKLRDYSYMPYIFCGELRVFKVKRKEKKKEKKNETK